MAITMLSRQTLGFDNDISCPCGTQYCQPFLTSDTFTLYGTANRRDLNNLLSSPFATTQLGPSTNDYWDLDADWSIGTNKLIMADAAAGSSATYRPKLGLVAGHIYLVTVSMAVSAGSETFGNGALVTVNGDNLIFPDLTNGTGNFLPSGFGANLDFNYTWVYIPETITSDDIVISRADDTGLFSFEILTLRILKVSVPGLALYDLNGQQQLLETDFAGGITLNLYLDDFNGDLANPEFTNECFVAADFTSNNRYFPNTNVNLMQLLFGITIPVEELNYTGCGTIRIFDNAKLDNFVLNSDFDSSLVLWSAGNGWSWITGRANFDGSTGAPPPANGFLEQNISLQMGYVYNLSFLFSDVSGDITVQLVVDGDTITVAENVNVGGTMSYDIDLTEYTGTQTVTLRFKKGFTPLSSFNIDNIVLALAEPDEDNISNCVNIQVSNDCTLLFEGVNTDNGFAPNETIFGYTFDGSNITRMIRLLAKKKYSGYPEEKEVFEFSDNSHRIMFAKSQREYEINIGDAAQHAHDILSIIRLHDTFTIDDVEYIPSSDYELRARKTSDNSQAVFLVREKQGISSNYSCS